MTPAKIEITPARPAFFNSLNCAPKAVATMAKSRIMPPPIRPMPLSRAKSATPRLPPVATPPYQAASKPTAMAMAEP